MIISKHTYLYALAYIYTSTYHGLVAEDQGFFASPIQSLNVDEIIQGLNSVSCKGDRGLEYLEQVIHFFAGNQKNYAQLKDVFKLFSNRYKGLDYVNAKNFSHFLNSLYVNVPKCSNPPSTIVSLNDPHSYDRFTGFMKKQLIEDFSTGFDSFKYDPEHFITTLAQKITEQAQKKAQEDIDFMSMQNTMVRFLEIAISKIIWSPYDQEKTWDSFKQISKLCVGLLENNIISDLDALDDLLWSLVHRYSYFVDLTSSLLTPAFYEKVLRDLNDGKLIISVVEEQDELLKTKQMFLKEKILNAQAKALVGNDKKL